MIEVRFHGRGGQGAVIAANILGTAAFKEGKYCQCFGVFAGERRGAPVAAYTRIDDKKISLRCSSSQVDHVIVLDQALMEVVNVIAGARDGAWILINSNLKPEEIRFPDKFSKANADVVIVPKAQATEGHPTRRLHLATIDAGSIAVKHGLGSPQAPIVNTAMLGAFARVTGIVSLEATLETIREEAPVKKEENVAAAKEAYDLVRGLEQ